MFFYEFFLQIFFWNFDPDFFLHKGDLTFCHLLLENRRISQFRSKFCQKPSLKEYVEHIDQM